MAKYTMDMDVDYTPAPAFAPAPAPARRSMAVGLQLQLRPQHELLASDEPWDSVHQADPRSRAESSSTSSSTQRNPFAHQPPLPTSTTTARRSANRVKAKAANPHVISSILDSLAIDTLTPLPDVDRSDQFSDSASRFSRAESTKNSVASSASIHRNTSSPGFGVEYGNSLELDDEEGLSGAALPPTIPTSRPPSGLSNRTLVKRPAVFAKATAGVYFKVSPSSRRSSFSARSTSSAKNKLSAESWVRQSAAGDDRSESSRGRRSLRRVGSHEMLRPSQALQSQRYVREKVPTSLAERIIARSPPQPPSQKPWLYLTDDAVTDEGSPDHAVADELPAEDDVVAKVLPVDSPITTPSLEVQKTLGRVVCRPSSEENLKPAVTPPLKAPSPISDSIPTRTSSLRQSPASGKRKSKKSKRHSATPSKTDTMSYKRSKSIPDASWADLDEDDETVKRIKELRQLRKSRMQEMTTFPSTIESPHEVTEAHRTLLHELAVPQSDELTRQARHRQPASGAAVERPGLPRMRSSKHESKQPRKENRSQSNGVNAVTELAESSGQINYDWGVKRPLSLQHRPTTSRSEASVQPPSLDYSYSQAVDALNGIEPHQSVGGETPKRPPSEQNARYFAVKSPDQRSLGPPPSQTKSSKKPKRSPEHRWTVHPDIPLDFEKRKSRRKSMSDARHGRGAEEDGQLERRDSIEDAVVEYLDSPRLTRTVKNATSGRTIAFSEVGDPEGAAVFICVGMGLTRYVTAFFDELATTLRLRLITLDRPGVGRSEPFPSSDKSGPLSWPEDVLAVCQHLGIVKFSILAHSAGAIYALATALILPHLVKGKVHLLAPWVPPSQLEAISHPTASAPPAHPLPRSQRLLRVLPTPFLKAANSSFMTATSASLKPASKRTVKTQAKSSPPRRAPEPVNLPKRPMSHDRPEYNRRESMMMMDQFMPETNPLENFPIPVKEDHEHDESMKRGSLILSATASPMDPGLAYANIGLSAAEHADKERKVEYTSRLTRRTWDLATRDSNPATDLVVCLERTRDVGFRYTDVGREVVIHHGSEDKRVPLANVQWLAEQMNRRALGLSLGMDARESKDSWADPAARGGCEVRVLQGEGHGLMASPLIMGDVLTEIAGYWIGPDKGRL